MTLGMPAATSWSAPASKFESKLKSIELCNGSDRSSPEPQIKGCTAIIDSENETALVLAIAHNNRGDAYATKGDFDLAIKDYNSAIKLNPNFSKPFNNRGVAFQKKGDYERALKDFDEAIRLSPDYARAFANRAETNQKRRDYQQAARDYDDAIRLQPDLKSVWNGRCWARAVLDELQPALADCNKALLIEPKDATALDSRGLIYLKMGQFDSAIADYSSALRYRTQDGQRAVWTWACPDSRRATRPPEMRMWLRRKILRKRSPMISRITACTEIIWRKPPRH